MMTNKSTHRFLKVFGSMDRLVALERFDSSPIPSPYRGIKNFTIFEGRMNMVKASYLGDSIYFDNLDEAKAYYNISDASDIDDINEALRIQYDGMVAPILTGTWYAVMTDCNDDWSYGSFDKDEALAMMNGNDEYTLIAVIENDVCIEEIYREE